MKLQPARNVAVRCGMADVKIAIVNTIGTRWTMKGATKNEDISYFRS